jgi:hypothetical protein
MRASVRFAMERAAVIDDLRVNVMPGNSARAENLFHPRINKVIQELGGSVEVVTRKQGGGRAWRQRVVVFPDKSTARMPTLADLRNPEAEFAHPKQRRIAKEINEFQQTQEIAELIHRVPEAEEHLDQGA